MDNLRIALITELLKIRRSRIFSITIIFFIFISVMMSLMVYLASHPETAEKLGLVGVKATMFGKADFNGYLELYNQVIAIIGYIGFGFITAWTFGREYTDNTLKDILALPVSLTSVILAKFIIIILWCVLLCIVLYITGLLAGYMAGMSDWSTSSALSNLGKFTPAALLSMMLIPPVAFFAVYGRGVIAPIAFIIITLIISQFVALSGWGPFFPWSIPGVFTAPEGVEGMQLTMISYIILIVTFLAGVAGTLIWWNRADQH